MFSLKAAGAPKLQEVVADCSTQQVPVGLPSTCRGRQQWQGCSEPTQNKAGVKVLMQQMVDLLLTIREIYRMEPVKFLE